MVREVMVLGYEAISAKSYQVVDMPHDIGVHVQCAYFNHHGVWYNAEHIIKSDQTGNVLDNSAIQ